MITLILGVFHHFCKSARSASLESLHSDGSATYLLIIWVEKIIPLAMKSKQKPYPSIVFSSPVRKYRKSYCSHPGVGVGVSVGVGVGVGVAQNVKVFG